MTPTEGRGGEEGGGEPSSGSVPPSAHPPLGASDSQGPGGSPDAAVPGLDRAAAVATLPAASYPAGSPELAERMEELLQEGKAEELAPLLEELHPRDIADLLEWLEDEEDQDALLAALPLEVASETLAEMEEGEERGELLSRMTPEQGAALLHELADDDAADLLGELEPEEQDRILAVLPEEEAGEIRELLSYPEDTAGGIMTTWLVSVDHTLTAGEALAEVRRQGRELEDEFYTIFVVDDGDRLLGTLPLYDLVLAEPGVSMGELAEPVTVAVTPDADQEEVGRLFRRYNVASVPVVDPDGILLGRITFDDIIDVIEEEQTEDFLRLAGASDVEELRGAWLDAVRLRLPWLALNLVTAGMAASVVYAFSETIEQAVILASVMPIVAGMGGNAGTQALAVTVRRIALSSGPLDHSGEVVVKEMLVGLVNGAALGTLVALVGMLVPGGSPMLGLVVFLAMWGNTVVAGFAGASIPTVLHRFGVDPAVASSVFVTTLTDLCGFFLLLGLGSALLL